MTWLARPILLLAGALALAGCPKRVELKFGPEGQIEDPAILLQHLDRRSAQLVSIKAEAKVRVRTPQQSGTVTEFIAAMRPGLLHLETLNFFGKPVAVLVSDGETFALFHEDQAAYYTGPATAQNVSQLLPIVVSPRELTALLLGDIPRIRAEGTTLELDEERGAYLLTLKGGDARQRIWVDTERLLPLRSEIRGISAYDLNLSDYEQLEGLWFAKTVELISVDSRGQPTGVEVRLSWRDVELNFPADLTLFSLPQPPGTELIRVDAEGRRVLDDGERGQVPQIPVPLQPTE